jgi:hypothetical protein
MLAVLVSGRVVAKKEGDSLPATDDVVTAADYPLVVGAQLEDQCVAAQGTGA